VARFTRHQLIPDVIFVDLKQWRDERGWFMETYKASEFAEAGISAQFVQENQSFSARPNVLRGLHFQVEPRAQAKLVRCTEGRIFDVAVDIREGSPTYRKCACVVLTAEEPRLLWVPVGFAHGFLTMSEQATVVYKQTSEYAPSHERSIRWSDPELAIPWPLAGNEPVVAAKDAEAPLMKDVERHFAWGRRSIDP
jgi:dTDP-4-dehydrorhamnose 3,5-epimerase